MAKRSPYWVSPYATNPRSTKGTAVNQPRSMPPWARYRPGSSGGGPPGPLRHLRPPTSSAPPPHWLKGHWDAIGDFGSRRFNIGGGKTMSYGRAGLVGGLGFMALRNGANMVDRMRYGDYGGAMMSGALTAAAGYGAYTAAMSKNALRGHFDAVGAKLIGGLTKLGSKI